MKRDADNDNFDTWSSLSLATAMILDRLDNKLRIDGAKFTKMDETCPLVSSAGLIGGGKATKSDAFAIDNNLSGESTGCRFPETLSASVSAVLQPRSFSEVADSVVETVAVDMVDLFGRPHTKMVKPREAMGEDVFPVDRYFDIPAFRHIANDIARPSTGPAAHPASENSSLGVICKAPAEFICGDMFSELISHGSETREEHQEQSDRQTGRATAEKQCDEEQRERIDQRLNKGTALSGQVGETNRIGVRLVSR